MNLLNIIIETLTFLTVVCATMYAYHCAEEHYRRSVILKRLFKSASKAEKYEKGRTELKLQNILYRLGVLAAPKKGKETETIRKYLSYAGYRVSNAVIIYFGVKLGLGLLLGIFYLFFIFIFCTPGIRTIVFVFFPISLGYYLPELLLKHKIASRHRQIFRELPDTLDLLTICMEAGLSFDMALYRVSKELSRIAPVLSREFSQYFLEIKSGLPREEVLKNLAERNGEKDLSGVVSVLLQSAKFGTDIVEALKVYSSSLRTERRQIAEEKAAKISTKLTFPTIFFILPALLIVVLGPALINLLQKL
ncbi:MAG TPA: type II secretion system F family protein [Deltaproteobacteria bacterium]|nr:type II secretion system F family protein [Deltaproteobacteria bacterium]